MTPTLKGLTKGEKPVVQSRCLWVPTPSIVAQKSEHLSSLASTSVSAESAKSALSTVSAHASCFPISNIIPIGLWCSVFQPAQSTTLSADFAPIVESPQSLTTKSRSRPAAHSPRPLQTWCDDSKACASEGLRDSSALEERRRTAFQYHSGGCQVSLSPSPVSPGHVTCLVRFFPEALAKSLLCRTVLGLASCDGIGVGFTRHVPLTPVSCLSSGSSSADVSLDFSSKFRRELSFPSLGKSKQASSSTSITRRSEKRWMT